MLLIKKIQLFMKEYTLIREILARLILAF